MGEKTTNKTHRLWMIIVSLIIATAAILAIVVIATIGSKTAKKDEPKPIDEATAVSGTPEIIPVDNSTNISNTENGTVDTNTTTNSTNSTNTSTISATPSSTSASSVPDTGPSDVIGLALLFGSAAMYLTSLRMAKAKNM